MHSRNTPALLFGLVLSCGALVAHAQTGSSYGTYGGTGDAASTTAPHSGQPAYSAAAQQPADPPSNPARWHTRGNTVYLQGFMTDIGPKGSITLSQPDMSTVGRSARSPVYDDMDTSWSS
jgi:hypothetical protein